MCVSVCVCVCVLALWSMMCQYILYYECVLFAITSVRNDHMCAVFQITNSILSHCGNVSHAIKTWKVLKLLLFICKV